MKSFKFFQKKKIQSTNRYIDFDMDECVINVLKYKQYHNHEIVNNPTLLTEINVPIANTWLTITTWRNYQPIYPLSERIEVDYTLSGVATTPIHFTLRMDTEELLNRIRIETV